MKEMTWIEAETNWIKRHAEAAGVDLTETEFHLYSHIEYDLGARETPVTDQSVASLEADYRKVAQALEEVLGTTITINEVDLPDVTRHVIPEDNRIEPWYHSTIELAIWSVIFDNY